MTASKGTSLKKISLASKNSFTGHLLKVNFADCWCVNNFHGSRGNDRNVFALQITQWRPNLIHSFSSISPASLFWGPAWGPWLFLHSPHGSKKPPSLMWHREKAKLFWQYCISVSSEWLVQVQKLLTLSFTIFLWLLQDNCSAVQHLLA